MVHARSRLVSLSIAGWLAATGCGGEDAPAEEETPEYVAAWQPKSGARLEARYLAGEDGSRVFEGWFDRERGEYCQPGRGEDGRIYCFPQTNPAVFRDARCREILGLHSACSFKYTGLTRGDSRCANESLVVYEQGDPVNLENRYEGGSDACAGPIPAGDASYVAVTRRLPDRTFVSGSAPERVRADLRLGPRVVRFEDGAVAPYDLVDSRGNQRCVRVSTTAGSRCLPESVLLLGLSGPYFGERTCTEPVAHADAPACLRPTLALDVVNENGCVQVKGVFEVGERLDPRWVHTGPACENNQLLPGHFYAIGKPLALADFPEIRERERGKGRVRVRSWAASDGAAIPHLGERLWDSSLGVDCRVAPASDGQLRCLPLMGPTLVEGQPIGGYADATCSRPLARFTARGCGVQATFMAARVSQKRCPELSAEGRGARGDLEPGRWEIFRLGARHTGDVFFRGLTGCQAGQARDGDEYYEMGQVLPPSMFVSFRPQ